MPQLDPDKKQQLDSNIKLMLKNGASEQDIINYANDFNSKYALKKKESSRPISQEGAGVSPTRPTQQGTSSDTEPPTRAQASVGLGGPTKNPFESIDPFMGKGAVGAIVSEQQKTATLPITSKSFKDEENTKAVANKAYNYAIDNLDIAKSYERLNDEEDTKQFTDAITEGLKILYNVNIATPLNKLNSVLGGDKDYFTSTAYKPLEREKKQYIEEIRIEKGNQYKPSEEEILQGARDIFIKNDKQEQLHQLIDKALPFGYDREGIWKELKIEQLNSNDKLRSAIASAEVFKSELTEFNNIAKEIKSGDINQEKIDRFNQLKEKATVALDGLSWLQNNYDKLLNEAKTDSEKLELFKYNYDDLQKTPQLLWSTTKNIFAGTTKLLADTSMYLNKQKGDYVNPIANLFSDISSEVLKEAEAETTPFYRYKASNINNWSDFGSFASQLGAEQIPIIASIYFGGNIGTAAVSMSSGGQKIFELEEQEKQPFSKKYSDGEKLAAAWLYSGAEFIPERLGTARILKDIERTVSSASTASRKMFMDSFFENTFKGLGKATYATGLEGGTEYITAESQINIDKELLDIVKTDAEKNELRAESFFSGALMGGGMALMGGGLGFAVSQSKLYSEKKDIKAVRDLLSKIDVLNKEVENNKTLTEQERTTIYKEINTLNNKAFAIVDKNAKKGVDLSIQEKSFLLDVNQRQGEIRNLAEEIRTSNYSKEIKRQKLEDLKKEFDSLEEKRNTTLKGGFNKLTELPSSEVIRLKDKAARELMKELNPDGTKTITINDSEITKRAIQLLESETKAPAVEEMSVKAPTVKAEDVTTTEVAPTEAKPAETKPIISGQKVSDVLNRPAALESFGGTKLDVPIEGEIYQEGQRVIFEDKNKKTYDLGNIDEISDSTVEDLGIQPQTELMSVTPEGKIKVGDNTWNIQTDLPNSGVEYDADGNVKAVSLKDDNGKTVMYEGQIAEDIAYQTLLNQTQTSEQRQAINEILENDEELNRQLREAEEAAAKTTGEVVESSVAEAEVTATEEIAPSEIETTLDEVITPASKDIKEQIARAKRALSKLLPNVEIVYHTTAESFKAVVGDNSRGYYDPNTKKIHINGSNATNNTVAHEVFHAVILKYITSDKQATALTNRMFKALVKSLKGNPKLLKDITDFSKRYEKREQSEEKLAEVLGYLASEYETLPDVSKNIIQKWLEKIAVMLKIKPFTDKQVLDFMNTIATKVAYGQEIKEGDVNKVLQGGKKVSSPSQLIRRQKVGAFDVEYTEKDKLDSLIKDNLVTEPENTSFMSNEQVAITSPDDMLVGTISIDGKKIFEGGGGVFFVTKYGDVWASGNERTANTLAGAINKSLENNKSGKGYLVLTKGSDSKLISSVSGVNSSLSIFETILDKGFISLSDFRKAVSESVKKEVFNISVNDQIKNYKKENKLSKGDKIPDTVMQSIKEKAKKVSESNKGFIKLSSESKQLKTDIETYFSDPSTSTFETRGNVIKDLIGRLSQSKSIKENFKKIIDLLGGDNTKKLGKDKTKTSESLADLIAGVASENLTKGLNVGDVYAIIEVNGEVKVKKDSHPSYPFHVVQKDGKKPILHLPKLRESGSKLITTSTGKPYTVGQVSIMSGTFNDVSGRKQISPENSSNYANMTEDGKGNFVFYHFGPRGIESIDPKKYGSNKGAITSKPEVAAMGRVGGMSQFYTMPEYQESNVSGDKYMIKVPMDKVYDFNTDPDNLYDKAREMFKRRHPDLPFTANDQLAHITKLAEKAGYDMTVAEWNNMSRAQSTKALKPVDTQVMDGNVISKPFKENYESNSTKGFEPVIPTSKEDKLKEVYDNINEERNTNNRYDSLYRLREDFPKLSQAEITDMIESSDISQEMKDAYTEALAYEPGARMSGRRQVDPKAIAQNTKAEVDRVKSLPIKAEDGATFNLDGTKYEGGGLVVPMNSLEGNTTQDKLSPEMIGDFAKENEDSVGDEAMVKMGIYKFPDSNTVSIDMNIVIPNEHRDVALEFGKLIGQESLFDLDTFENVKTGGDGLNPMKLTAEQFREAASSLKNGVMPTFVSGRRQKSPIDTAVEIAKRKGFNDKDIADYLVVNGYTRAQATNAILRYNNITAVKLRKEDSVFTKEGRNKIITFLDQVKRRALSARSFLPKSVFLQRENIESNIKAEAKRASYLVDEFNKLVNKYKGDINQLNNEFDKYLRGDQSAVLPDEFKAVAGKMRIHIDNLSQNLLRTGAVSVSQAETIAANLGQYINRSYQVFDKKDWAKQVTDEMKEAARVDLRNMYRAEAETKAKQTGLDADIILEDFINKKIDELISGESAATFLGVGKTGAKDLGIMKQRLDIPLSIRQLMGEYTDASQNYARTVLKITTLAENARFLQSAREAGMGVFFFNENDPNRPKEFNTKIAGDKSDTMSPLNGLYTTPEIAKAFTQKIGPGDAIEASLGSELGPVVRGIYETYMKALSAVKWLKTIGSFATHAKNVTGNLWFMLSNGYYNPKKYAEAFRVLKNSSNEQLRDKLDEYIRAGIIDQSAALGEIKAMFSDANFETAIDSRLKKNPFEKAKAGVKRLGQKMSTAYQLEDDFFKIISYESEKDRYSNAYFDKPFDDLTDDQKILVKNYAAEITKNVLPNYARIPGLVKLLKAVPVTGTFVSFQAEAYRTAWNTVALAADELKSSNKKVRVIGAKRLAGIAASQATKFGLMAVMGTIVSGGDDDEDDELKKNTKLFVAPWSKDSDLVLVNYGGGKMSYIDFSASDPHGGIKKAYNSVMAGKDITESFTNGLTQLLEPFMKEDMLLNVITDIKNNENSYGGKLYNESDTDTNKINAIMSRVYKAFEPGTITSVRKVVGSDDIRNELAGQLTGYKINTVDVNKQLGFKMNELKDLSGDAKKLYSSAFYKFEDGEITGEELDRIYEQANKSQKDAYKKMMDYMNAASFFGVDDYMIEDNMQGVGKSVINDLWYGEAPDMKMKEVEE